MISVFVPLLAAALVTVADPGPRIFDNVAADAGSRQATLYFELYVAPDREILDCRVTGSEPVAAAGQIDCQRVIGKKVATPALGPDGLPAYSLVSLTLAHTSRPATPADLVVEVADLPGRSSNARVNVVLFVDAAGVVTHCQQVSAGERNLADAACRQAGSHRWRLRNDRDGAPVGYSESVAVDFVEQSNRR